MLGGSLQQRDLGGWLLSQRWSLVALASLVVLAFESLEYRPFLHGISASFLFEVLFYGILLPAISGVALSLLAASRARLAWASYVEELQQNLRVQLSTTHSQSEVAAIFLQFIRTVTPSVQVELSMYDQQAQKSERILSWAATPDPLAADENTRCNSVSCPLLNAKVGENESEWTPCLARTEASIREDLPNVCMRLPLSSSTFVRTRLYFSPDSSRWAMQNRLLLKVSPEFAAAFERVRLEERMKGRDESLEAEHQRLARDVHDSLGQSLAYLRLKLEQIGMQMEDHEVEALREVDALRDEVVALGEIAREAYDQMREVLAVLTPESKSALDNVLKGYADKIRQRVDFDLQLQTHGRPRALSARAQRHVYYIFREALGNVERHAHARQVSVDLKWEESMFTISIVDDGSGFDVDLCEPVGHFGVANMRNRAQAIGADLDISSGPGRGTHVTLRVPVADPL
ncbi:MAG TPA: sensor histidine kinase [Candidatus Binatia bacterium]|nr:sensor histidine kinase [Candidatus Binatia bacterium]